MYCPDCGRAGRDNEQCCPDCGYPLSALRKRLADEEEAAMGWAEKIVGKPRGDTAPPDEAPLTSFATGKEQPARAPEKEIQRCDFCGRPVDLGESCPHCGDKLPSIVESDPWIMIVLRRPLQMLFAPRQFALGLPYPPSGGILQPLLYPVIPVAFLIASLPFIRSEQWIGLDNPSPFILPALLGSLASPFVIPVLILASAWIIDLVARLLGGKVRLTRTTRLVGAYLFWFALAGAVCNLALFVLFRVNVKIPDSPLRHPRALDIYVMLQSFYELALLTFLALCVWISALALGALYRLTWLRTVILVVSTYWLLLPVWIYLTMVLPLHLGGLL